MFSFLDLVCVTFHTLLSTLLIYHSTFHFYVKIPVLAAAPDSFPFFYFIYIFHESYLPLIPVSLLFNLLHTYILLIISYITLLHLLFIFILIPSVLDVFVWVSFYLHILIVLSTVFLIFTYPFE